MNLTEIITRQTAIKAELDRIERNPAATDEHDSDMVDTLVDEWDKLEVRRKPLADRAAKLDIIRYKATEIESTERTIETPEHLKRVDPFEDMAAVRNRTVRPKDMIARAHTAIERAEATGRFRENSSDRAQRVTELAQNPGIARHILMTGSEEYEASFREYMADPETARTALSLTAANGGYLLPYVLDPTIVLTNAGSANPWRRLGTVKQTTSNAWQGVTSAGVNAAWLAEATEASDNSPTVGQIQITPEKASAWLFGSYEVLEDTDFGSQLPGLIADARDRLEEAAFATGAGHGSQVPLGVLAAIGTGTGTNVSTVATGGGSFAATDIYALQAALPARWRMSDKLAWVSNISYINKIRALDTAGGSSFWANLGDGTPERLLNTPIAESTTMTSATATGSQFLLYGDFAQFYIVDRIGMSLMYEPMVKGTAGRPTGQAGWFAFWRASSGVSTTNAFKALKQA